MLQVSADSAQEVTDVGANGSIAFSHKLTHRSYDQNNEVGADGEDDEDNGVGTGKTKINLSNFPE